MVITGKDIKDFITAHWKRSECPRCDHSAWDAGNAENFKGMIPLGDDSVASISEIGKALPVIWLVCKNCGHVEFIGIKTIRQWQAGKDAAT